MQLWKINKLYGYYNANEGGDVIINNHEYRLGFMSVLSFTAEDGNRGWRSALVIQDPNDKNIRCNLVGYGFYNGRTGMNNNNFAIKSFF